MLLGETGQEIGGRRAGRAVGWRWWLLSNSLCVWLKARLVVSCCLRAGRSLSGFCDLKAYLPLFLGSERWELQNVFWAGSLRVFFLQDGLLLSIV